MAVTFILKQRVHQSVLLKAEMIRKLGRFVEFSVFGKETTVDWSIIGDRKELDIRGAHLGPYSYEVAIDLFSRGLVVLISLLTSIPSMIGKKPLGEIGRLN